MSKLVVSCLSMCCLCGIGCVAADSGESNSSPAFRVSFDDHDDDCCCKKCRHHHHDDDDSFVGNVLGALINHAINRDDDNDHCDH